MIEIYDDATVQLERLLPGPLERVWEHLTQPELAAQWLPVTQLEPREGGAVTLRPEGPDGPEVHGVVTRLEAPRVLAFAWSDAEARPSELTLTLQPEGGQVRLVLAHWRGGEQRVVAGPWPQRERVRAEYAPTALPPPVRCLRRAA